ncbi:MAG: helix-turn-helix domain-containing protein [Thiofilum sp.]|uniref:AraC family transcriptional regulator n=1 Tax=Thiofilum sp. TaxID=2212733 RepID=UPI0025F6D664|nr:helix-turn-helix domain-containing protein [Thiofilum sp.]MBK8453994.1 AraC family transcriptional regulator [Thiofilum sp.]
MLTPLALLLIGYSVFSALLLSMTHLRTPMGKLQASLGVLLLALLSILQLSHFAFLQLQAPIIHSPFYTSTLFAIAPSFYLFTSPFLYGATQYRGYQLWHYLPVLLAFMLSPQQALLAAFLIGAGYLIWLANRVYALRAQRNRFKLELVVLGAVFIIALGVAGLVLLLPWLTETLFFSLYASAIGLAFLLINGVLNLTPELPQQVTEAAQETYAVSTLTQVNCPQVLERLTTLMQQQRFTDPDLDLATLANELGISSHQLSELINLHLGKGFARYIREWRVEAAKTMLLNEPKASVLSIGLSVGFNSQSNFYAAFREITGMTPSAFRKLALKVDK